jgi:signal transduction histidine kinase
VRDISETAERVSTELRYICSDLRAVDIDRLGLVAMLKRLAREFQRTTAMPVDFKSDAFKKNEIPREIGIHIYRIMQESMHNAVQHAGGSRVSVALRRKKDRIILTIADNGKGISLENTRGGRGLGIPGMKERAALCRGKFRVEPASRGGTKVSLEIPLPITMEESI